MGSAVPRRCKKFQIYVSTAPSTFDLARGVLLGALRRVG